MKQSLREIYRDVLGQAEQFSYSCFEGKRWNGIAILIVLDTSLTSTGVTYSNVVSSVEKFNQEYISTKKIDSFDVFSGLSADDKRLRKIFNSKRSWNTSIAICTALNELRKNNRLKSDFTALDFWAKNADYEQWQNDIMGKIYGVGLTTFQYLRLQAGIDTIVPDRKVTREAERKLAIKSKDQIDFIKKCEAHLSKINFSPALFCWAVWLS